MAIIRTANTEDLQQISKVVTAAFNQANEARLVEALYQSTAFVPALSLVAEEEKQAIGHILFTKINIENQRGDCHESLALAPVSVLPELQGKGIGGQLIKKGIEASRLEGFDSIVVLGHDTYYPRFGFEPASKWNIQAPFPVENKYFMAMELVPEALQNVQGTVIYPNEFSQV
ncbi:N-acetyltransferase [Limibacter armeniacum]|uniref:GNAT family N-acetyltransferase n=1 Tax=Limibacter armeniacum TaxID=466084 RepID=UPI002FE628FE